eukprot:m51a1_g12411 hypothetical protein (229) ;mRNA; f:722084-722880
MATAAGSEGQRRRVLCIGDSLTEGLVDWSHFCPYSDRLAQLLASSLPPSGVPEVVNLGVSGEATSDIAARVAPLLVGDDAPLALRRGDVCVLLAGTNNMCDEDPGSVCADLGRMHSAFSGAGARVLVLTIPYMAAEESMMGIRATRRAVNEWIRTTLGQDALDWAASCPKALDAGRVGSQTHLEAQGKTNSMGQELWSGDGLHMTKAGYLFMAEFLHPHVLPLFIGNK